MRLHQFIGNYDFSIGRLVIKDADFLHQIKNVLRLKTGEQIILGDGASNIALAQINRINNDSLEAQILKISKNENESGKEIILYCSILKRENFELVAQKATEVGIKELMPIICQRTIKLNFKRERLEKIIKEAAEQSGRGVVPVLNEPIEFARALEITQKNDANFLFDQSGEKLSGAKNFKKIGVFIGPEGGWTQSEVEAAKKHDIFITSLGKLTLRAETAAIVASYILSTV